MLFHVNSVVLASVCIDVILWSLLVNNPSPHRCPLWLFFGFASRGGVVWATDGLCRPSCLRTVMRGKRGAAFSTESPAWPRVLGLVGLVGEHEATLHRTYLRVLLLCPSKVQFSALPVRLSRRGRIPSAVNDLVQFTLCKVVFVYLLPRPFLSFQKSVLCYP